MTSDVRAVPRATVGPYTLGRLLGRGGVGAVYEAEAFGRRFALKLLDAEWAKNEEVVRRFAREARAAAAVKGEHVVDVLDAGADAGTPFLVMELLEGEDLGRHLARVQTLPVPIALHVIAQALRGLSRAHAAGVVHRDLKPDNVFLAPRGGDPYFVKILDFGVSKLDPAKNGTAMLALTRAGVVIGTPFYVAPEQARGLADVDWRADLYGVGAILFECLTGRPPHVGETDEQVLLSICTTDPPDPRRFSPDVPAPLAAFVKKALTRDRAARFRTADEMLAALNALNAGTTGEIPILEIPGVRRMGTGKAIVLAVGIGAIVGGTVAFGVMAMRGGEPEAGDSEAVQSPVGGER